MVTVDGEGEIGFQEYFVRRQHDVAGRGGPLRRRRRGPPGARACSTRSPRRERVVIAPVEPDRVDRPGARRARRPRRRRSPAATDVVAVSPIVAGAALKGPADRLLAELGHESSVVGVARLYAPLAAHARRSTRPTPTSRRRGRGRGRALRRRADDHDRRPTAPPPSAARVLEAVERPHEPARDLRRSTASARSGRGDDLAGLIADAADASRTALADGDVVVVTQKIVSKAEGRLVADRPRRPAVATSRSSRRESVRILRRRGDLIITETRHGFVCANAGIDLSNVEPGLGRAAARRLRPLGPPHPRRHRGHGRASRSA